MDMNFHIIVWLWLNNAECTLHGECDTLLTLINQCKTNLESKYGTKESLIYTGVISPFMVDSGLEIK